MSLKRKLLYGFLGALTLFIAYVAYVVLTTKSHSPADIAVFEKDDFKMSIYYCQPYKKGRLIFGKDDDGALVPFGKYWRTGANEATEIEISKDIILSGQSLPAGRYRFYTVPGEKQWSVIFNSELGKWGAQPADKTMDVLEISAPSTQSLTEFEQFSIKITEGNEYMNIKLIWDNTEVAIPFSY